MVQTYNYRARNVGNQVVAGVLQADGIEAARKILIQNQLTPLSVEVSKQLMDYIPFLNKVNLKERSLFTLQLATMIESGLTLTQGLQLILKQNKKHTHFGTVMEGILSDLQDGFSFSTALAKYPEVFDQIYVNVIRAGEVTGKLEMVLKQLATTMEEDVKTSASLKGALFYPAFIMFAMVVVAIVMITVVIPQLKDVFASSGQKLPASTQFLLDASGFLIHKWYEVVAGVIILFVAIRYTLKNPTGFYYFSKGTLKLPVFGLIIEQSSMARFARLLGMMLDSGVPMLEALRMVKDAFTNPLYKDAVSSVASEVERGIPMSAPINRDPLFPIMVGQMVAIGEQSGKMDEVLYKLASYYDNEVQAKVSGISKLIEPFIIVVLGIGVAWLVIAILLPVYQASSSV